MTLLISFILNFHKKINELLFYKTNYINNRTKIIVYCINHGEFEITPNNLMLGRCCPLCSKHYHYNNDEIIQKFNIIHNNKYDYSKVEYINNKTKVCIICPEHGEFWQAPYAHSYGQGCPKCKMSHSENNMSNLLKNNLIQYEYESNINGLLKKTKCRFLSTRI